MYLQTGLLLPSVTSDPRPSASFQSSNETGPSRAPHRTLPKKSIRMPSNVLPVRNTKLGSDQDLSMSDGTTMDTLQSADDDGFTVLSSKRSRKPAGNTAPLAPRHTEPVRPWSLVSVTAPHHEPSHFPPFEYVCNLTSNRATMQWPLYKIRDQH